MKPRRVLLLGGPFVAILLIVAFYLTITADRLVPYARGEKLTFAQLEPNETITVTYVFSHLGAIGREYHVALHEQSLRFTAFNIVEENGHYPSLTSHRQLLTVRPLFPEEAKGLDALVAFFRTRGEESSSATQFYRFEYLRDGKKIGEELFIGFWLVRRLDDFAESGYRGNHDYDDDYTRLATENGLTRAELDRLLTFRMLERSPVHPVPLP